MLKKQALTLLIIFIVILNTACGDYTPLSDLSIVAGIGVDWGTQAPGSYTVTFEVVDTGGLYTEKKLKSSVIQADGKSIHEAIANANKRSHKDLFFGKMKLLVINSEIAEEEGVKQFLDALIRDVKIYDNLFIVIARGNSSEEILKSNEDKPYIVSYRINDKMLEESVNLNSLRGVKLYKALENLLRGKSDMTLPALKLPPPENDEMAVAVGQAIFEGDKVIGYLNEKECPMLYFLTEKLNGGYLSFFIKDGGKSSAVSFEIYNSKPSKDFRFDGERLEIIFNIETQVSLLEIDSNIGKFSDKKIKEVEKLADKAFSERAEYLVRSVQQGTDSEIFGMADYIYQNDLEVWNSIKHDWIRYFKDAKITVNCSFSIFDSGLLINS